MKKLSVYLLPVLFFLLISASAYSQKKEFEYQKYDWDMKSDVQTPDTFNGKYSAVILKEYRSFEYSFLKNGDVEFYQLFHKKIKVLNDEGIEAFNKIYISMSNVDEVIDIKARFISKQNKVTEISSGQIKDVENYENLGKFKLIAVEGAEPGGIIEYMYVFKQNPKIYSTYTLQSGIPRYDVDNVFVLPDFLGVETKTYNNCPEFEIIDQEETNTKMYKVHINYVPALEKERYSAYDANLMRLEFSLSYNYNTNSKLYNWSTISKSLYESELSGLDKCSKQFSAIVKDLKLQKLSQEQKIRKIEDYVKANFVIVDYGLPENADISWVLENKYADVERILSVYAGLFDKAGIAYNFVITCDRFDRKFDPEFEHYNFLDDYLIYFPEVDKYIDPKYIGYRLGYFSYQYEDNYGLFFEPVKVGKINSFLTETKKIKSSSYTQNADSTWTYVSLNADKTVADLKVKKMFYGHCANYIQPYYKAMKAEDQLESVGLFLYVDDETEKIKEYKVENIEPEDFFIKPFVLNAEIEEPDILENAGNTIIVKIGEVIGEQAEMYSLTSRKLPVETDFCHSYYRNIVFEIPEGYKVEDVSSLSADVSLKKDNDVAAIFRSVCKLSGNKVTVEIVEFYKYLVYAPEVFENYKAVINAAADFNKKTIVLKKI